MSQHARVQVRVAEQRHGVHDDRDQRRQRQRLVGGAQVEPAALDHAPAHREADADRRAREQERGDAGGAGGDPEQVLFHAGHARPGTFGPPQRKLGITREEGVRRRVATDHDHEGGTRRHRCQSRAAALRVPAESRVQPDQGQGRTSRRGRTPNRPAATSSGAAVTRTSRATKGRWAIEAVTSTDSRSPLWNNSDFSIDDDVDEPRNSLARGRRAPAPRDDERPAVLRAGGRAVRRARPPRRRDARHPRPGVGRRSVHPGPAARGSRAREDHAPQATRTRRAFEEPPIAGAARRAMRHRSRRHAAARPVLLRQPTRRRASPCSSASPAADGTAGESERHRQARAPARRAAGEDYTETSTTVTFADGDDSPRLVELPILQDDEAEPAETFSVSLSDAQCAALGDRTSADATILDDDTPERAAGELHDRRARSADSQGSGLVQWLRSQLRHRPLPQPTARHDTGFGDGEEIVSTDFNGKRDQADGVAVQRDGKIVVAGFATQRGLGTTTTSRSRATSKDGTLDREFRRGRDRHHRPRNHDGARPRGRHPVRRHVVVAGTADGDVALVRYTPAGKRRNRPPPRSPTSAATISPTASR